MQSVNLCLTFICICTLYLSSICLTCICICTYTGAACYLSNFYLYLYLSLRCNMLFVKLFYLYLSSRCNLLTFVSHLLLVVNSSVNILIYCWKVGGFQRVFVFVFVFIFTLLFVNSICIISTDQLDDATGAGLSADILYWTSKFCAL